MANRIKGLTIEIGGDTTKLDKALSGTNKEIKQTQSELKDVERLLKLDPKNTELLTQKQKLLAQGVEQTGKKLEELHKAEQALKASGVDENSQQFMALRREIIDTEQQMKGFKTSAKDASKGVKDITDQTKAVEGLKNAAATAAKAFAAMAAAAGGVVIGTVTGLAKATKAAAEYADTILTQSITTGIATDKLQEYAYAAELVDVSVDTLTGAIARTIRSMNAARNGTKTYIDAFKQLGVKIKDSKGNLRDSEDVFWDIVTALGKMKNETERDALAMTLLGKSAQDLNPLIKAGKERMDELAKAAHEMGVIMDEETLEAFGAYDDNLRKLENIGGALKRSFGQVLLPILTSISQKGGDLLGELTKKIQDSDGDIEKIAEAFKEVIPKAVEAFKGDITAVAKVVTDLVKAVADVITDDKVMKSITDTISTILNAVSTSIAAIMPAITAVIKSILQEIPRFLGDILPPLIELATDLINDVFLDAEFLAAFAGAVVKSIEKVGEFLWNKYGPDLLLTLLFPTIYGPLKNAYLGIQDAKKWFIGQGASDYTAEGNAAGGGRNYGDNGGGAGYESNDGGTKFIMQFNGDLASVGRVLQPSISLEDARRGTSLTNVRSYAR